MSLSTALHSALSGITAAGRASGVVSENIANALTPGYSRRSLVLDSQSDVAPGVRVTGLIRHSDPVIIANRRSADAQFGNASALASFRTRVAGAIGTSTDVSSIASHLAEFDTSLISASSRPDSSIRLDQTVLRAKDLATALNNASDSIQSMRSEADRKIDVQVRRLNEVLSEVQELNTRITGVSSGGGSTASLMDQRQALIDEINTIVPVQVAQRDFGQVALYTDGGVVLLDGQAATVGFSPVHAITPGMTQQGGALSGLDVNGVPLSSGTTGPFKGGTLAAQFEIRDELAIAAQADLDAMARDLIERFEDPAVDPTLAVGDPGLFTDNGAALDVTLEVGLAGRIEVNSAVDPAQGGESWRMRDGINAAVPGPVGDARLLQALSGALTTARVPSSGDFGSGALSASELGSILMSRAAENAAESEQKLSFASATQTEMKEIELAQGVDTDAELSHLMLIEQAYAANARMLEVVDEMMQQLLRI